MSLVIDYMMPHSRAWLEAVKADHPELVGVVRYLDPYNPKCLQPGEVEDIFALGLELHLVFEIGGAGPWTFEEGVFDYQAALKLVETLLPGRTKVRVYFAADRNDVVEVFDEYANGLEHAEQVSGGVLDYGIYGYENLMAHASAPKDGRPHNYPLRWNKLWQTYGHSPETSGIALELWQYEQQTWHGVDVDLNVGYVHGMRKEEDMANPQELWDSGLAEIVQQKVVAPQADTDTAIKAVLTAMATTIQELARPNLGDLAASVTAMVEANTLKILSGVVPPVPPSCPAGTSYFGESADGSVVGWKYPDGTTHYWKDGVDATQG